MTRPDLNLLAALDVLLAERSVAAAARRLRLSPSAMSRTLTRLRTATGDPLLVRAGRSLVPTPRALELRGQVGPLLTQVDAVLRPAAPIDVQRLERTFTLRSSEGFVETFGPDLLARVAEEAPAVRLRFLPKPRKDNEALRDGSVDLETGVVEPTTGSELRVQALFRDRLVGVVRAGHPLTEGRMTAARYASGRHVSVTRGETGRGPVDAALEALGLERDIVAVLAGGFATALALARASTLIATVPELHTTSLRAGLHTFELPVPTPPFTVSLLWHPRMEADAGHRWLRHTVREVCAHVLRRAAEPSVPDRVVTASGSAGPAARRRKR